jgi:uncharacterized membrane protein YkoI
MHAFRWALLAVGLLTLSACDAMHEMSPFGREEARRPAIESSIKLDAKMDYRERDRASRIAELVKIPLAQAVAAAEARVPGKTIGAELRAERGNLLYIVSILPQAPNATAQYVAVDPGNGSVLDVSARRRREE